MPYLFAAYKENIACAIDNTFSKEKAEPENERLTALFTATVPSRGCQNEPKSANRENSAFRPWVPTVVKSGTDTGEKSI